LIWVRFSVYITGFLNTVFQTVLGRGV